MSTTITKSKIILEKGKPSEIILKWKDFLELLEKIEDFYDIAEIKKTKKEKAIFKNINTLLNKYAL